jgi:hypothetical protein
VSYYSPRMPFGKHRDQLIEDVPTSYLHWLLREVHDLEFYLKRAVEDELKRRGGSASQEPPAREAPPPLAALQPIVQTWFRRLSLKYHPDRGGSDAAMKVVNNARDLLMELLAQ